MTTDSDEPIKIIGIDTERAGTPRNDGTPGSALYRVPIKLNRRPSREWAAAFPEVWDRPPQFSTRHRPGIGSVSGDCIILDGTTVEEIRDVHAKTLSVVVAKLNEAEEQYRAREAAHRQQEAAEQQSHGENVRRVADNIRFD